MDVHLRDLRYFVAVAEHLHFTRAADALYISQPTLSKQLRALEGRLRVPLFERDRRAVRLTPAGAALLPHARAVLEPWSRAEEEIADVLDEPFLALPATAGPLRDHWLAAEARGGRPPRIGAEIANTEETVEALLAGLGVRLLSAGNTPQVSRPGIAIRPITGVAPS